MLKRLIAVCALVALGACASEAAAPEEAEPTSTTEKVTTTTEATTTTTEPPTTTTTEGIHDQMVAWSVGALDYAVSMQVVLERLSAAVDVVDLDAMVEGCDEIAALSRDAMADTLPVPDPGINVTWKRALEKYEAAGIACSTGAQLLDYDLISSSADLLTEATALVTEVTDALGAYES